MVYPLIKGENIAPWSFSHKYILLPHDAKNEWKPIPEEDLRSKFAEAYVHLNTYRKVLDERVLYATSKSKGEGAQPFYSIMEISSFKLDCHKVVFAKHATQLEAAFVPERLALPSLGSRTTVLDTSAYFPSVARPEEGLFVTAFLNSTPVRAFAYSIAEPKGGAPYKQFFQWTIGVLPVPKLDEGNPDHRAIIRLASKNMEKGEREQRSKELHNLVCGAYGLDEAEMEKLRNHISLLQGRA